MKHIKKISVLIPLGEDIGLVTVVINCLSRIKNIDIYLISDNKYAEINRSNKIKNISYYTNDFYRENWIDTINTELEKFQIDIIMPVDEFGTETAIKNKEFILQKEKLVFLPSLESFRTANNKGMLSKHLEANRIPAPKSFLYSNNEKCTKSPLNFPILIKPLEGLGGGRGISLFKDEKSFSSFFEDNEINYPYLLQNYIEGYDIDCSVLCKNGEILAYTIQKAILAGKSEFAPNDGLKFLHKEELYNVVKKLMKTLKWSGVAHIDMRYDTKDMIFKVIEINPRFWGTTEGSEIAGVNFPYLYCLASLGFNFNMPEFKEVRFFNLLGLRKKIEINKLFLFRFKFIFNNTSLKYYIKDPKPLLMILYYKIKNSLKR